MSPDETSQSEISKELSGYLAARSRYERERSLYKLPEDIPANKDAIVQHLQTQIRQLASLARKYGALRDFIKKIPRDENDPIWQMLRNTVVYGTIEETSDDPERGPEGIWLARE